MAVPANYTDGVMAGGPSEELLLRPRAGDEGAFRALVNQHHRAMQ
jgi:hypothetical protein